MTNGKNGAAVIDQIGDDQILNWEELSTIRTVRKFVARYNKYVIFRDKIPLDVMAGIQARNAGRTAQDALNRTIEILRYILVEPAIKTEESARAIMKADSNLMYEIIGEVMGRSDEKLLSDGLGEAPNLP